MRPPDGNRALTACSMALLALMAVGLAGCDSSDQQELQQWMTAQRNATNPRIAPLSAPTRFTPQSYGQQDAIEPFSNQKLVQVTEGGIELREIVQDASGEWTERPSTLQLLEGIK